MYKNNGYINSAPGSCVGSCVEGSAFDARPFLFALMILGLLLPFIVQADGLFDFQMKLANKGNAEAEFKVGEMYETGFGVEQDMKEAESWIKKSASHGHETAGFKLLYWDLEKNGINDANKAKVDELNEKAKAGNEQAQYYVGKMYAHGVGVKKDPDAAIDWLGKSALVGVLAAERELVSVKEERQRETLAKRREQEKQAELKQREKQLELERQQQLRAAQQKAKAQALADQAARQRAAEAAAAQKAADAAAARKAAEDAAARKAAENQQREAQQSALLKQKQVKQEPAKQQFEADPCSGKSARFLSTCR